MTASTAVLVTGGGGFLGARLVRALIAQGDDVHLIVRESTGLARLDDLRDRMTLHRGDLTDADATAAIVRTVRPRTVFHIAATGAHGARDGADLFRDNVLATFHLLLAAAVIDGCRVIHTASSLEPGQRPVPIREDDPFAPLVPYGATKAASTLLARQAAASGQRVVMLRPFAIYGPGEPDRRLIPTAIRAASTGTPMRLTTPGYTRDLIFVDDVVEAYLVAAQTDGIDGELINIATGRATPNEETIRVIERIVGRSIPVLPDPYPPRPTDTPLWCADVSKASRLLGWRASHNLEQGLAKTVAWFLDRSRD